VQADPLSSPNFFFLTGCEDFEERMVCSAFAPVSMVSATKIALPCGLFIETSVFFFRPLPFFEKTAFPPFLQKLNPS